MINCFYDCYTILNKVYSEGAFLKQAISSTFIEEKNRSLTVKTVYGVLDKDIELSYYIKKLTNKNPKLTVRTVLKIALYHIKYLGKQPYAVTDNAVSLIKKLGKGGVSGFVNAFLRKFATSKIPLPEDKLQRLSVEYSYPVFAVKKLIKTYGEEQAKKVMLAQGGDTTLVFFDTDGEKYLTNKKINFSKTPFENVYKVKNFIRNEDYDKGVYTYQSIGSVAICNAINGGIKLLDCCAAPGGKSVNLSRKFKEVYSQEIHPHRTSLIEDYAFRMGVKNVNAFTGDATVFNEELSNQFDTVLCDVPCSGYGVAFENPDIKLNKEEKNIFELVTLQKSILDNCCRYLKKGGKLFYSTCSVFQEENDGVIKSFLDNNKDFKLCQVTSPLAHLETEFGLQFLPDVSGGGFYLTCLEKI